MNILCAKEGIPSLGVCRYIELGKKMKSGAEGMALLQYPALIIVIRPSIVVILAWVDSLADTAALGTTYLCVVRHVGGGIHPICVVRHSEMGSLFFCVIRHVRGGTHVPPRRSTQQLWDPYTSMSNDTLALGAPHPPAGFSLLWSCQLS